MMPLVILQAALVAFTIAIFLAALDLPNRVFGAIAALLAFGTPVAWFTSYAMPDIFAGVTILVIAVMTFFPLTRPAEILLALAGAFAIASHPSHVALAILLLPLSLGWRLWVSRRDSGFVVGRAWLWVAAPALLGILAVLVSGMLGFGEVSLAPRRHPLALGRAIGDGPTRWYLESHCATRHYAVCELYPNGFPKTSAQFLWGPNGIRKRATASQMERIRNEEQEILLATAAAYPSHETGDLIGGALKQLVTFRVDEADFNVRPVPGSGGGLHFVEDPRLSPQAIKVANVVSTVSAFVALAGIVIGLVRAGSKRRALVLLLLAGLIANAAICAFFAGVDDRYQARVIWLLPLAAIALLVRPRESVS
jgi:hypothetical protein